MRVIDGEALCGPPGQDASLDIGRCTCPGRLNVTVQDASYARYVASFFQADLHLLTEGEGGRTVPIRSGYQALALFGQMADPGWGVGVTITFDAPAELAPGDSGLVRMISWTNIPAPEPGTLLRLLEAGRLVASGTVTAQ